LSSLNKVLSGKINCDYVLENLKLIFFNTFDISTDVLNSLIINTSKKKKVSGCVLLQGANAQIPGSRSPRKLNFFYGCT